MKYFSHKYEDNWSELWNPSPIRLNSQRKLSLISEMLVLTEVRLDFELSVGWLVVTTFSQVTALRIFMKFGTKLDIDK